MVQFAHLCALIASTNPLAGFWHWIEVHTGTVNESGPYYGFWSGFGSDIGEILILGGVVQLYRKHNCHVKGCYRIARHPVQGTDYIVCKKHHPNLPEGDITHQHILDAYKLVNKKGFYIDFCCILHIILLKRGK